jgi:site-specific recombinase XerD
VFYNLATGDRFRDVKTGLGKAVKEAGLEDVTWHTFRHTFASRLTRDGVDIVTVTELLGHSTITVTMRYAHTNQETKARAVKSATRSDKPVTVVTRKRKTE